MAAHGSGLPLLLCAALMALAPAFARAQSSAAEGAAHPQKSETSTPDAAAEAPEALETKNIFGFTSGTDIGPIYDREIEFESDIEFGRRAGQYLLGEQKATLEYNPTAWLEIDTGFHADFARIRGVEGMGDRTGLNFGGLHQKYTFVLIQRAPATPVGLAVSVEPEWARINDDGRIHTAFTADTRIIVDTELVPATLYAGLNAIYEPDVERDFGDPNWTRHAGFGVAGALAYRVDPALARGPQQMVLGAELEYFRTYEALGLAHYSGDALLFGPTFYIHFNETLFVAGAISTQIAGRATGDPRPLNLDHFSRNKAQLTVGINF